MDYEKFTLVELRQLAREKGASNVSKLKKGELVELLQNLERIESKVWIRIWPLNLFGKVK